MTPLVSVAELAPAVEERRVTLLDVRWQLGGPPGYDEYQRGHVPGASYVDLERDLADPPGEHGRHPLPDAPRFVGAMRRAGVDSDRPVVVYDAATSMAAARAWWLLRHYGHRDVRVLDGGYAAWVDAGLPSEQGDGLVAPDRRAPGDFVGEPGHLPVLETETVLDLAQRGVLVDARAPERYRGETEPIDPVGGHIPGAVNLPTTGNVGDDGRFLDPQDLRARFAEAGVAPGTTSGSYCGSGVTAAHQLLAMGVAGLPGGRLYPGSWSEWITDPTRPVATGE